MLDQGNKTHKRWVSIDNLIEVFSTVFGNFEGTLLKLNKFEKMTDCWTSLDDMHILEVDLANETGSGGIALNLEHARHAEYLLFDLFRVLNGKLHVLGCVRCGQTLEVADFVVEWYREG